jgi:hypothetical protein
VLRVPLDPQYLTAREAVGNLFGAMLRKLSGLGLQLYDTDPLRVSSFFLFDLQQRLNAVPPPGMAEHQKFSAFALISLARELAQACRLARSRPILAWSPPDPRRNELAQGFELVCCHGCESALNHLLGMMGEGGDKEAPGKGKRKGQLKERHAARLFSSLEWEAMLVTVETCAKANSHPKVTVMCELVREHFAAHGDDTRVMIFSTCREGELEPRRGRCSEHDPSLAELAAISPDLAGTASRWPSCRGGSARCWACALPSSWGRPKARGRATRG